MAHARRTHRILACGAVLLAVLAGAAPAAAHTEVLRASPSPAEEVEGPVEQIELVFLDPVRPGVTIDVTDDLGDEVPGVGESELSEDRRSVTQRLPDLEGVGDYVVEYTYTAEDGDTQRQTYRFTIVAASDDGNGTGPATGSIVGVVAAGAVVVAGIAVALLRRRRTG